MPYVGTWTLRVTGWGPLTILTVVKGLITYLRVLLTQFRALTTLLVTRGPHPVGFKRIISRNLVHRL